MSIHYEIFGFSKNPSLENIGSADHKFNAKNKREVVGLVKTMIDNFDVEYIAIFRKDK